MSNTSSEQPVVPLGSLRDVPNQITVARLAATIGCFVCLSLTWYGSALVLFILAASTDWADGYWARRWGPITKLGRVLDPLADKLLICGVFVYLATIPGSRVYAWMAVVVLTRELMVTTLRAMIEGAGGDFSAVMIGKLKMVAQCVAGALGILLVSRWGDDLPVMVVDIVVWASVLLTILSGWSYVQNAAISLRAPTPLSN